MRIKLIFSFLFLFVMFNVKGEELSSLPQHIKWTGIDRWTTGKSEKSVISFEGASYPDNSLPYFTKTLSCENNSIYNVNISNPTFVTLNNEEAELIKDTPVSTDLQVNTFKVSENGNSFLKVQIFPFVQKDGQVLKLQNFDINIEKSSTLSNTSTTDLLHTYAQSSVLASGKFVKIKISESGIYKLTYENLSSMGIDPANVRIFGYGGAMLDQNFMSSKIDDLPEVAIYMNKGADGVFNAGDYILFYAQGVNSWSYDYTRKMFTHTLNVYSNDGYYFVTSDVGSGKKISDSTVTVPEGSTVYNVDEFVDYQVHEKELTSILNSGKVFYGEKFDIGTGYNFPFSFPNIVKTSSTKIRVDVMALSLNSSSFTLKLNDTQSQNVSVAAITNQTYEYGKSANVYFTFTPSTDNLITNLNFNGPGVASGYLNYIEINTRRKLVMDGSVMFFRNVDNLSSEGNYNTFQLSGANENTQIWDITDPQNIKKMQISYVGGVITFTDVADVLKQYVAIDPTISSAFSQPTIGSIVPNQNLHALDSIDFVIITNPRFLTQANQLADVHRTKDNMRVAVMTTDQVYNEFSSGTPDATAYRWVMKMLYDRALASNDNIYNPKYLLLFGRGTYDNRKLLLKSSENLVLTYQSDESLHLINSYTTDDYFGLLDNSEGTNILSNLVDIGIGRFTVLTDEQATNVVNKTVNYMNNEKQGIWKNQLCFVGDDGGGTSNDGNIHMFQADSVARMVYRLNNSLQIDKVYLDAYKQEINASGESYPLARAKLLSLINSGTFMLNFTGHASAYGLTNEQVITTDDVKNFYNLELPLWIAATCDFVAVDADKISAGEYVLLNPTGGGIGIFASARTVYSGGNFELNKLLSPKLFTKTNGQYPRLGDAVKYAKNGRTGDLNRLPYGLLGDPALKLNYPSECQIITDGINNNLISGNDTIKALSVDSIQGHIADFNGNTLTDFNGTLEINIYDKNQEITTLNNHNESNGVFVFDDRPNIIYSGKASIKDGKFSFVFMVPKDIRYNYGAGRINYYASETDTDREGQGYFENFIIGGASSTYDKNDTVGPDVSIYLNYNTFKSGGKVNETPLFVANIFDKNGINTVGSGIGHDLRLIIDDDPLTSYTLNDDFIAETNSYTNGSVQYKIPTLIEGKHTLTFRAWDLLNNSTTAKLDFEVVNGLTPNIFSVSCYPNPANTNTNFVVNHDRPETVLETTVEVYDLMGRKIWSKTQSSTNDLRWDLTDTSGRVVQSGIYLYRVSIKTSNSSEVSKTNKIIVTLRQ